ncbi:MAG: radical SAM protein [bacterium]
MTISSKARILLIYPPNDPEVKKRGFNYSIDDCQPLGLGYVAAALESSGYKIKVIDAKAEALSIDKIIKKVVEFNPAIIGLSVSTPDFYTAVSLARQIKARGDYPLVIGGRHISALPEETMEEGCFDYGVVGEGECTVVELAEAILKADTSRIQQIKGIVFRNGPKITRTPPREQIEDLDTLSFPARHLFPSSEKYPYLFYNKSLSVTTIITSRGCSYRCTFCDHAVFGNRVRMRSIKNVVDEVEMLVRDYGISEINIIDDIFPLRRERVEEFGRQLRERGLKIPWICSARVDSIDPDMLKIMKDAGCWMVVYGIESSSQKILDVTNKNITAQKIEQAVRWTREAGIAAAGTLVFGLPGEDRMTIRDTMAFVKRLCLDRLIFVIFLPLPGSEFYRRLSEGGELKNGREYRKEHDYYFPRRLPFIAEDLTIDLLKKYRKKVYRDFYLRPSYIAKRLFIHREFKGLPMRIRSLIKAIF